MLVWSAKQCASVLQCSICHTLGSHTISKIYFPCWVWVLKALLDVLPIVVVGENVAILPYTVQPQFFSIDFYFFSNWCESFSKLGGRFALLLQKPKPLTFKVQDFKVYNIYFSKFKYHLYNFMGFLTSHSSCEF